MTDIVKNIKSLKEIERDLSLINNQGRHLIARKWRNHLEHPIMTESRDEVPIDTHALQRSGQVDDPVVTRHSITIEFGYGVQDPETGYNYAAIQHENPDYKHKPGRKWKYLEDPFNRNSPEFPWLILRSLDTLVLGKAGFGSSGPVMGDILGEKFIEKNTIESGPVMNLPEKSDSTQFEEYLRRFPD